MTSVESRVEQVTVYASGARVRRVATVESPGAVRLIGLPLALIDDSVSARVEGGAVVTAIRVTVETPAAEVAAEEASSELRTARVRLAIANAEVDRIDGALQTNATIVVADDRDDAPAAWSAIVAARRQLVALHTARELRLREQHAAAKRAARDAREALAVVEDREARASSARAPKLHELRKVIELEMTGEGASIVRVEYRVAAARWAPSYVARLEGDHCGFEVRAVVAQETGEDWQGVALRLSTAEPEQFSVLPELAAQRIGRRQDASTKSGFRAPPQGARALYADFEDAFPAPPVPVARPQPASQREAHLVSEVWDDGSSNAKDAFLTPPSGQMMPPSQASSAPMPKRGRAMPFVGSPAPEMARSAYGGGGAMPATPMAMPPPPPPSPEPTPRLDYTNLVMAQASSSRRGALVPAPVDPQGAAIASLLAETIERISRRAMPPGCSATWTHTYDYAFASDGNVDVQADGAWHSLALTSKSGTAKIGHVAVPREQPDVFRVASIPNPLPAPLLPGPIDVYDRGRFLVTSAVGYTPPGATVEVGLGVDATVKIARNTEFREEATGMLRGALRLHHGISIDVENLSGKPIDLEIRERVPVRREGDDDIEVTLGKIEPMWERWTPDPDAPKDARLRGAYRWRLAVPAGAKKSVRAAYEVKIAGKLELVGGNRRES